MNYKPTLLDASTDLRRAIYASFSKDKFDDINFKVFYNHAMKILEVHDINSQLFEVLKKAKDKKNSQEKRRENLLMASILLQSV